MTESTVSGGLGTRWKSEHRNGICIECNIPMILKEVPVHKKQYSREWDVIEKRPVCPKCGGMKGQLIVALWSITPPKPPDCLSFRCIIKYFRECLFCALLANYHSRRVTYARKNRNKKILERYRTGEPSPETIWQAIHANIKLKCPICNKFNRDPFLFRRGN